MRKRSEFLNATPVDDEMTVLDLLSIGWDDGTERELLRRSGQPAYVEVRSYYRRGDYAGCDRVLVTESVAERLLAKHYVAGKPEWGYTDMGALRITKWGDEAMWAARAANGSDFPRALSWFERVSEPCARKEGDSDGA